MNNQINVLIVDDSAVVRQTLSAVISSDPKIRVSDAVADPIFAINSMRKLWPDVIVLDLEMPRMNGMDFLKKIMLERPTPVVICSAQTQAGAEKSIQCLSYGAFALVPKPGSGLRQYLEAESKNLIAIIKAAANAKTDKLKSTHISPRPQLQRQTIINPIQSKTKNALIAIGTSTGGTQALEFVLSRLGSECAPIVIVQHMPAAFTGAFAQRLDSISSIRVKEAENGDLLSSGTALLAPGGKHMIVRSDGTKHFVSIIDGPPVNRHKPSVDVLFQSVCKLKDTNRLGIIMTGMGDDGARGLLEMRQAGAYTIAQNEATCVVYGMPREAVNCGAVDESLSLSGITESISRFSST